MAIQIELIEWTGHSGQAEFANRWDELFDRSTARLPTSRFEHVNLWFDTFAPQARRQALVAEADGRWLAAVPLRATRFKGFVPAWEIPYSYWTPSPEILLDHDSEADANLLLQLIKGFAAKQRWLIRADELSGNSVTTTHLQTAYQQTSFATDWETRYEIGQIEIRGAGAPANWDEFQLRLSGNFRRQMRKMMRRAESLGGVELVVERSPEISRVTELLQVGFEIEDRGWKGANGTSVLRSPGMFEFFIRQASLLAGRGEMLLLYLRHGGEMIAFEYGWSFNRTYFSPKIAYDESFSNLSPGHLLMHLWVEQMFRENDFDCFDFCGPLAEATAKWASKTYPVVRLLAGTGMIGNQILRGGRCWLATRKQLTAWTSALRKRIQPAERSSELNAPGVS